MPSEYEESMARLRVVTDAYAVSDLRKGNDKWFGKLDPEVLAKPRKKTGIAITEYPATTETQFWESCKVRFPLICRVKGPFPPTPSSFPPSDRPLPLRHTHTHDQSGNPPSLPPSLQRTVLQYKREPVLTRARLINSMLMGCLLGLVYFDQDNTYKAVQNKIGVAFIVTMNQCISATFGVVQEVPRDFAVFMREYLAGANRVSSYFLARTISEIPFQVFFPFVFGSIVYGMVGLRPTAGAYFTFCVILILCANAAVSMGYALSALFRNTTAAIAAGSVVIMPMALFSGLLLDMDVLSPWLRPLQFLSIIRYVFPPSLPPSFMYVCDCGGLGGVLIFLNRVFRPLSLLPSYRPPSFIYLLLSHLSCTLLPSLPPSESLRYTYHAIIINEYANQPINCGFNVICPFRTGNAVLTFVGAEPDELAFNMGMLFVFMLCFRLVAFGALKWHSTRVASL